MPFPHPPRRLLLPACLLLLLVLVLLSAPRGDDVAALSAHLYYLFYPERGIGCYRSAGAALPDVAAEPAPSRRRRVFFHETSCASHFAGKVTIGARQACAVESAARLSPEMDVFLLYASPGTFRFEGTESDRMLQALLRYENVKIRHVDYGKYTKNTPVEGLYTEGKLDDSGYSQSHASDVLRYLTLWKYGGIYLDLDVIVTQPLSSLPPNFAGSESERNVAAGVLGFSGEGLGHTLARLCLEDLRRDFRGSDWGYNGPGVITRLLQKICDAKEAKDMLRKDCHGFRVYPPEAFYAVPWWNWTMYFDEESLDAVLALTRRSRVVHVWNKHSGHKRLEVGGKAPYVVLARKYCPNVMKECGGYF